MAIVVISFDGVGDKEFERLAKDKKNYPNIAKFMEQSIYQSGVKSVFVSNTQPAHVTISTGKLPSEHGIVSNHPRPDSARWVKRSRCIKAETIWERAGRSGMTTAAIFWPLTCGAAIRWNIPGMCLGSHLLQLRSLIKHGTKLLGITPGATQPYLDNFATAVACNLLRSREADLTLVHFLAYDAIRHRVGGASEELDVARQSLDRNLGKLLDVAGERTVLICSDHSHLDVRKTINLMEIYGRDIYEQCGGSAFFKIAPANVENYHWFGRFLNEAEMGESGYSEHAICGIAAKVGYAFGTVPYKSNHGYPADYENYRVFYAIRAGKGNYLAKHEDIGIDIDIRDIYSIILRELGI